MGQIVHDSVGQFEQVQIRQERKRVTESRRERTRVTKNRPERTGIDQSCREHCSPFLVNRAQIWVVDVKTI